MERLNVSMCSITSVVSCACLCALPVLRHLGSGLVQVAQDNYCFASLVDESRDSHTNLHGYIQAVRTQTHMAANQKHWPCNRLGRPFRDKGL